MSAGIYARAIVPLCLLIGIPGGRAATATTIDPANHLSYGANIGWCDWRGDTNSGAVIGEFVCSGIIYIANAGWINLGNGSPANGIRYQNNSGSDFGVNHDGFGNLQGFAYSANLGWLSFTNRDRNGDAFAGPAVNLANGQMSGFVWSANGGWISLANAQALVQTDVIPSGIDSDGDGIPDAWELLNFGKLSVANGSSDFDHDGYSDLQEYLAGTDPMAPASNLRITGYSVGKDVTLTWTSVASRQYRVVQTNDITTHTPWIEVGLGLISPDVGATTTRSFPLPLSQDFFLIQAVRPLSP